MEESSSELESFRERWKAEVSAKNRPTINSTASLALLSRSEVASRTKEPESALDHYEEAVEREAEGKLGESLSHYQRAFRVSSGAATSLVCLTFLSWMTKSTSGTRRNIFQILRQLRNLSTRELPMHQSQFQRLHITP